MDLYTRCPHCQTVFRLASEQLDAAGGRVRCGACLRVFPARNSLVRPKNAPAARAEPAPAAPASRPPAPATAPAPQLDFDSFFAPTTAPAPAEPSTRIAAPAPTPAPAPVVPAAELPLAPDFSLLADALTDLRDAVPTATTEPRRADAIEPSLREAAASHHETAHADDAATVRASAAATPPPATRHDTDSNDHLVRTDNKPLPVERASTGTQHDAGTAAAIDASMRDDHHAPPPPATEHPEHHEPEHFEPVVDSVDLAAPTAVPDDWAAFKRPVRNEPVFDDDNGLELDLESVAARHTEPVWQERAEESAEFDRAALASEFDAIMAATPTGLPATAVIESRFDAGEAAAENDIASHHADERRAHETPIDAFTSTVPESSAATPSTPGLDGHADVDEHSASNREHSGLRTDNIEPRGGADRDRDTPFRAAVASGEQTGAIEPIAPTPQKHQRESDTDESDNWFELHLDAVDAASAGPTVFADWHLDHNETVPVADADTRLTPIADGTGTDNVVAKAAATDTGVTAPSQRPPAAATRHAAADRNGGATNAGARRGEHTEAGDFGDISDALEQPEVPLRAPLYGKVNARAGVAEPVPFDRDGFTAEADDRIYARAQSDGLDDLDVDTLDVDTLDLDAHDSSRWSVAPVEPMHELNDTLYATPKRRFPWRGLLLGVLALLLLPLLIVQLLWPQRAVLREDPQWGSWVEAVCRHIECELPPRSDVRKIELQQRSVLKDRADPRKLQIDLLIANKASFAQPYPDINLRFTNIEGELVAERRFKPSEYLREQPDSSQMPIGVPVHIAFSVKAPDGNITGFEFSFLPPQ